MSIAVTMDRRIAVSPRAKARMAGVLYLLESVTSVFGQFIVVGRLVVAGNAATTAANVLAHQSLFWLGFTSALIAVVCHITYTMLFYDLLVPVNRSLALLAVFFSLVGCSIQALATLFQLAALLVLKGGYLSVFPVGQIQAQALLLLNVNLQAFNLYLIFFGCWLLLIGYLIVRSTFLPRILGVLAAVASLSYLILLSPPLASALYPYYLALAIPGEPSLMLWLLVVGVNVQRWQEQARAAGAAAFQGAR
jgi:hypothetical protein